MATSSADREGVALKMYWKIHDKPQGRWRPLLVFGVELSDDELKDVDKLNINPNIRCCIIGSRELLEVWSCNKALILPLSEKPFKDASNRPGGRDTHVNTFYACGDCPFKVCDANGATWASEFDINLATSPLHGFRLPWRPGHKPDYSDFIIPVQGFLHQLKSLIEERFAEARQSSSSDEWLLEGLLDPIIETEAEAEQRLRVIRR